MFKMLRLRSLLIMALFMVSLGPATAQRIYIDKRSDEARSGKPSVYIRKTPRSSSVYSRSKPSKVSAYNTKLKNVKDMKHTADKISVFRAWQEDGRKPETMEEIQSYAMSKRAVHQGAMLERRKLLIAHLERQENLRQQRLASRERSNNNDNSVSSFNAFSTPVQEQAKEPAVSRTRTTILKRPHVFVRPGGEKKSSGPYTRYR